jgi:hypothetical protein
MSRKAALAIALVVSAPAIYQAVWTQTIEVETAAIRFLIALIACAVLVGAVNSAMTRRRRR